MTERIATDVAIIGGGTAGCAAALALRKRGLRVVLLEKGACGGQASGVNFGGVRQQGREFSELPLARRSREIWGRLPELIGTDAEFRASGHLKLARSDEDMATLERYASAAADYGLSLRLLGRNAVKAECSGFGGVVIGGSLCEDDGQANPRLLAPAFARAARRAGAEIREHARVTAASSSGQGFELRAAGLTVESRSLINCAGAWAGSVAAWFGESVPIDRHSPNILVSEPIPHFLARSVGVCGGDVYVRQIERGNVIFGGGQGWGDVELERSRPLAEPMRSTMAKAAELLPPLRTALVIRSWSGLDGKMPDFIPVIGLSATTPGLVHGFGFSGHGFQLGPAVGEVLAELAADGETPTPIEAFSITRFHASAVRASSDQANGT